MRASARTLFASLRRGLAFTDDPEAACARARVSEGLPARIRSLPHQWLGTMSAGCAATWGIHERCDFACQACYLTSNANSSRPLSEAEVRAQLDTIRRVKGPGANTQITSGEVTLLPAPELARLVRYARDIGLDPMVMSHGETFLRDPTYLPLLMRAGGLRKVGLHVDATQRGRPGVPTRPTESDLMPVREALAGAVREARRVTGLPLHADHTMTVTRDNLADVPQVVRWVLRNADAFRALGLLPVADVGRTRGVRRVSQEEIERAIEKGIGRPVTGSTFVMGHPDCSSQSLFWVVRAGERIEVMEARRDGAAVDDLFFLDVARGAFRGFTLDDTDAAEALGRILRLFRRQPRYAVTWPFYSAYRVLGSGLGTAARLALAASRGEPASIHPFALIVHRFMSPEELTTDRGRERLAACTFKVPVDGRLEPMCSMNATPLRDTLIREMNARVVPLRRRRSRV